MRFTAKIILTISALTFLLIANLPALGQDYPRKTVAWIVPFSPGGGYDVYARALSPYLSKYLPKHVNIVVKNVPGGGGVNGVARLYKSKPDGHTIGYAPFPGMAVTALIEKNVGFDPYKLVDVAQIAVTNQSLAVAAKSSIHTLKDIQKLPLVTFGSTSKGGSMYSFTSLAIEMLGLKAEIVTGYGGGSELIPGILRGDAQAMIMGVESQKRYIESGDMRAILSFTSERNPVIPDVPCVGEIGLEQATVIKDYKIVFAPPNTPSEIQKILVNAFQKATHDSQFLAWAQKTGALIVPMFGNNLAGQLQNIKKVYTQYKKVLE